MLDMFHSIFNVVSMGYIAHPPLFLCYNTSMDIRLEKAYKQDIDALDAIVKRAFAPLYEIYKDEKSPYLESKERLEFKILYRDGCYYKIYCGETLCGGVFVYHKNGKHRIGTIYIDPEYQNKKIAQTALALVFDIYTNVKAWELDVPEDQEANIRCYTKMGFVDTGKREAVNERLTLAYYKKEF